MNHRHDEICDECRLIFESYLDQKFPRNLEKSLRWPSDNIYYALDSIRLDISKRKVEELYK